MDDLTLLPLQDKEISGDGETRLINLETVVRQGAETIRRETDKIALALLAIQEDALWRFGRDEDGQHFLSFEKYVQHLADQCKIARSSLFDYKSIARMALANGLVDGPDDYVGNKGTMYFRQFKQETVIDKSTGEIIAVKGVDTDDPVGLIQEAVSRVDSDLKPMDRRALIKEILRPDQAGIEIFLSLVRNGQKGEKPDKYYLKYTIYNSTSSPQEGFIEDGAVPKAVIQELSEKGIRLDGEQ